MINPGAWHWAARKLPPPKSELTPWDIDVDIIVYVWIYSHLNCSSQRRGWVYIVKRWWVHLSSSPLYSALPNTGARTWLYLCTPTTYWLLFLRLSPRYASQRIAFPTSLQFTGHRPRRVGNKFGLRKGILTIPRRLSCIKSWSGIPSLAVSTPPFLCLSQISHLCCVVVFLLYFVLYIPTASRRHSVPVLLSSLVPSHRSTTQQKQLLDLLCQLFSLDFFGTFAGRRLSTRTCLYFFLPLFSFLTVKPSSSTNT